MGAKVNELQLIEGGKDVRDKFIGKVEILERMKELSLLPDGENANTEMVAEFYGVSKSTIESVVEDNRNEVIEDGYNVLKGAELKIFKGNTLQGCNLNNKLKYARQIALFPRRAILRVGMLLRDSEVAKQVRTYLLNVEEIASPTQKETARKPAWTTEEDLIVLNSVLMSVNNDGTLTEGLKEASQKLNRKFSTVNSRWQYSIRHVADKEVLDKIKSNVDRHMKKDRSDENEANELRLEIGYQIDSVYRENCELKKENEILKSDNEKLKRMYKKLKSEHTTVIAYPNGKTHRL
ncbi:hypothetical protein [Halalkalibacter oceani]|uniref:hypothetical protein n=1 Tax=Halalkalibacter oceani TaxID=1653776 RepID=UPI003391A1B1